MNKKEINTFIKNVGLEIRKEREYRELSIKFMANAMNITKSYYAQLETTTNEKVSLYKYAKMTNIIGVPLYVILKRSASKPCNDANYVNLINYNIDELIDSVSYYLREVRLSKNITQKNIAKKLNITRQYYGHIETGKTKSISLYRYLEVTLILGVGLYEVIENDETYLFNKHKIQHTSIDIKEDNI